MHFDNKNADNMFFRESYHPPLLEIISVEVEQGFVVSGDGDSYGGGLGILSSQSFSYLHNGYGANAAEMRELAEEYPDIDLSDL